MAFECPRCGDRASLKIRMSLELPPDNRSDEIALQMAACDLCGFLAAAVYEESRRGSIDREVFNHTGYPVSRAAYAELTNLISACASPRNPGCTCPSHARISRQDQSGRWTGLDDWQPGSGFALSYSPQDQAGLD